MLAALGACHPSSSTVDGGGAGATDAQTPDDAEAAEDAEPVDAEADASVRDLIDHAITLLEDVGTIVQANFNDCDTMADRVEAYRNEHLDAIRRTDQIYLSKHAEEFEKLKSVFRDRYYAAWKRIRPGIIKCRRKPRMRRVLGEIWGDDVDAGF